MIRTISKNSFETGEPWSSSNQYDEPQAIEFPNGRLMINMRNDTNSEGHHVPHPRSIAWSDDGGVTFGPAMQEPALLEPSAGCQASLVRAGRRVFYSGPLGWCRVNMTIRTWEDGAWLGPDHDILVSKGVVLSAARPRVFACACACACACFSLDLFQDSFFIQKFYFSSMSLVDMTHILTLDCRCTKDRHLTPR